jgi:hypothetical protein
MSTDAITVIEPLIRRKLFATPEQAIRELARQYITQQIASRQQALDRYEKSYGMRFERFAEYLRERSSLLETGSLTPEQRRTLGQAIMREEDDWLEWKAAKEMLDNWLGLQQETSV